MTSPNGAGYKEIVAEYDQMYREARKAGLNSDDCIWDLDGTIANAIACCRDHLVRRLRLDFKPLQGGKWSCTCAKCGPDLELLERERAAAAFRAVVQAKRDEVRERELDQHSLLRKRSRKVTR